MRCYAQDPAGGANSAAPVLAGFWGEERKGKGGRGKENGEGEETGNEKEVKGESRGGKEKGGKWEGREKKGRNFVHLSFFFRKNSE